MSDNDLVKRLRGMDGDSMSIKMLDEAANRIEELEAKLDLSEGALDVASRSWGECQRVLEQTEAKLQDMALDCLASEGQAAEAYQTQLAAEAKLAQMQWTLNRTEDRAKGYKDGRKMMGRLWAAAEEDCRKAFDTMERAIFVWEQPHDGDIITIIDRGSEAIDMLRATLAELKGERRE